MNEREQKKKKDKKTDFFRFLGQVVGYYYLPPWAFQAVLVVKNPPANSGDIRDVGSIPGSGR